jgi:hypothetical protein
MAGPQVALWGWGRLRMGEGKLQITNYRLLEMGRFLGDLCGEWEVRALPAPESRCLRVRLTVQGMVRGWGCAFWGIVLRMGAGRMPALPVEDCGLQMADHRSQITDHRSQITDHRSQITDHRSQITDHRSQITDHRSQSTDHRAQITDHRAQIGGDWGAFLGIVL